MNDKPPQFDPNDIPIPAVQDGMVVPRKSPFDINPRNKEEISKLAHAICQLPAHIRAHGMKKTRDILIGNLGKRRGIRRFKDFQRTVNAKLREFEAHKDKHDSKHWKRVTVEDLLPGVLVRLKDESVFEITHHYPRKKECDVTFETSDGVKCTDRMADDLLLTGMVHDEQLAGIKAEKR